MKPIKRVFTYVLFSVTYFLYGYKMVGNCSLFYILFFSNYFFYLNGNQVWLTLFVKSGFCFKLKLRSQDSGPRGISLTKKFLSIFSFYTVTNFPKIVCYSPIYTFRWERQFFVYISKSLSATPYLRKQKLLTKLSSTIVI